MIEKLRIWKLTIRLIVKVPLVKAIRDYQNGQFTDLPTHNLFQILFASRDDFFSSA